MVFFCLFANYFGTDQGYKLGILQEGVVSKYKELFFNYLIFTSSLSKVTKPLALKFESWLSMHYQLASK